MLEDPLHIQLFEILKDRLRIDVNEDYVPFETVKRVHVKLMWNKQKLAGTTIIDDWVEISSDYAEFHVRH